jgi:4-amino-4-deoxy-L-arabinose transferase-like glycosyltransferase
MIHTSSSRGHFPALVAVLLLTLGLSLISLHVPFARDQGVAALVATTILRGGAPYRDVYHFNFPGIFFAYALAMKLFQAKVEAVNLADALFRLLTLAGIYGLTRAVAGRRPAVWAGLCYGLFSTVLYNDYWDLAQKETFTVLPLALAVWLVFRATRAETLRRSLLFWAGACTALACCFKPTVGMAGLALAAEVAWPGRRKRGEVIQGLVLLLAGFAAGWIPLLAYLLFTHTLRDMYEGVFIYGRFYGGQAYAGGSSALGLALSRTLKWLFDWRALVVLSVAAVMGGRRRKDPALRLLLLWTLAGYLHVFLQMKFFSYHWVVLLGPLSVLAGMGVVELFPERPRLTGPVLPLAAALLVGALALGSLYEPARRYRRELLYDLGRIRAADFYRPYGKWGEGDISVQAELAVAHYLHWNTDQADGVLVFGLEPGINFLAERRPPTRFAYDQPLTTDPRGNARFAAYQARLREEFLHDLQARPPVYVVVVEKDATSIEPEESYQQMQAFTAFRDWLERGYFLETKIEHYYLYRRKPGG